MKTTLAVVLALLSISAYGQTDVLGTVRKSSGQQATTSAAPTLASQGLPLRDVSAVQLLVCAPLDVGHADGGTRQYLDGGSLLAWYYDTDRATFVPKPEFNETLDLSNSNGCQQFPARAVGLSSGRLYYQASGVLHLNVDAGSGDDGGTGVYVSVKGWTGGTPGRAEKMRVHGSVSAIASGTDGGAVQAQFVALVPTTTLYRLADCASAGTTTTWVDAGTYRITGSSEEARLCWGATTCTSTTGDVVPVGSIEYRQLAAQNLACYSASSTADLDLSIQTR